MKISPLAFNTINNPPNLKEAKSQDEINNQRLSDIANKYPVINTFLRLAAIPSASVIPYHPKEKEMIEKMNEVRELTKKLFVEIGVDEKNIELDKNGSLIIRIPGTGPYENCQPLLLMGHLDIVPADNDNPIKPIHPRLINHPTQNGLKEFIATDGTTTLGADDKALVAPIWDTVRRLKGENEPHVPIEIVLVPDEETTCDSLIALDTSKLKGKDILVVDGTVEFKITPGCASFIDVQIEISDLKGGHSADDNQEKFVSAADLLKELHEVIGNRVVEWNPNFHQPLLSKNIYKYEIKQSPKNAIPTKACMSFSLRSNDPNLEKDELERIRAVIKLIENKYKFKENKLQISLTEKNECPLWLTKEDSPLIKIAVEAAKAIGQNNVIIRNSHGATQVNNLVGKRNAYGEEFDAVIIGTNIEGEHSPSEKVEIESMLRVCDWLYSFVQVYSSSFPPILLLPAQVVEV